MGIQQTAEDKRLLQQSRDEIAARNASFGADSARLLDPSSPDYVGPGYADLGRTDAQGNRVLTLVDPQANGSWKLTQNAPAPANPNPTTSDLVADAEQMAGIGSGSQPARSPQPVAPRASVAPAFSGVSATPATTPRAPQAPPATVAFNPNLQVPGGALERAAAASTGVGDQNPYTAPGAEAPKVDRAAVDAALAPVNKIQGQLAAEALNNASAGVAEAQLARATAQAQSATLGQARSGNRRDRAMLERQAIGEGAYLEQESGRQAAELRAQEELQNRQFKVDTLAKAGELGLNTAAYEVDLSKADLASANNWINNEFQQLGLDKQLGVQKLELNEQKMAHVLQFTQAMAAIQFDYDQLSVQDQNEADQLMMQRYQVDKQTLVALKQIKESGRFRWDTLLSNMVGGAVSGGLGLAGRALFPDKGTGK